MGRDARAAGPFALGGPRGPRGEILSSTAEDSELQHAREVGRAEGEAYERHLRDEERTARMERPVPVSDMSGDLRKLAEFHHAVIHSRSWRVLQAVRRIFGRAW